MPSSLLLTGVPSASALAWELLRAVRASPSGSRWLVIVPDSLAALNLRDDLREWIGNPDAVVFCPALETDLLKNRGPSLLRRSERLQWMNFWFARTLPADLTFQIGIVPLEALAQRLPVGPALFRANTTLNVSSPKDRDQLSQELVDLGYVPANLVESPGQFAVRGSMVDVFPPTVADPIRCELFDDTVQSLRSFDCDTQRRIEDLSAITIGPAREFLLPPQDDDLASARSRIRAAMDEWDWMKADRDAVLERLDQRAFFATIDYWAPLIDPATYEHEGWNDAPADLHVAWFEPRRLQLDPPVVYRDLERNFETARLEGEWVPAASSFLRPETELRTHLQKLSAQSELWLSSDRAPTLTDAPSATVASVIRTHDLLAHQLEAARRDQAAEPFAPLVAALRGWHAEGFRVVMLAPTPSQLERLQFLLSHERIHFKIHPALSDALTTTEPLCGAVGSLNSGFVDPEAKQVFLLDEDIFGARRKRAASKRTRERSAAGVFTGEFALLDLKAGDLIVHDQHGVGRYLGLKTVYFGGVAADLVELEYKDGAKLLVPVTRLDSLHKHSTGSEGAALDRLGGQTWETKKAKVRRELQNLAGELLNLYAQRKMARGPEIQPDKKALDAFAASFAHVETPDQSLAIEHSIQDLHGPKPMDRLVCGDVGYGKTEVALRAAHAALAGGWQVAVLVPTTILAAQHESTFRARLEPLGFKVGGLSRFKSTKEIKKTLGDLAEGSLDVVVGTHRLLSNDVRFKKIGLLVVDEEQRFGVVHKEKIKRLRANLHILTLTATPIPRTLNMALSGLREISIISTPPVDRLSIRTHIVRKKPSVIQDAIENELKRGGQVFYLHNRIQTMEREVDELTRILPGVKMDAVHGQMDEKILEGKMIDFYEGRTQVLVTTAIIESGLDIPNANTLIVDRADSFGLAQLYQIRGRVGRSAVRAHAYFLLPESGDITVDAEERLSVLETFQDLGSGFHIASHDLEIRGAGDLLGDSQSGHIQALGIDAYLELLQEAVAEAKGDPVEHESEPDISLGIDTTIPATYIPEVGLRLMFYRKLATAQGESDIDHLELELEDRFGPRPESVKTLGAVMKTRCQLKRLRVTSLSAGKAGCSLTFDPSTPVDPAKIVAHLKRYPTLFHLHPDGKLLIKRPEEGSDTWTLMRSIDGALTLLESWCG